jgi:hypothetical protein
MNRRAIVDSNLRATAQASSSRIHDFSISELLLSRRPVEPVAAVTPELGLREARYQVIWILRVVRAGFNQQNARVWQLAGQL